MRTTMDDLVADADKVAVAWTLEGTHHGELLGIPATGRHFRLSGMAIYRLAEGKITEAGEEFDRLNLIRQLGVHPTPEAPTAEAG
jgi:predicted ester cyclase